MCCECIFGFGHDHAIVFGVNDIVLVTMSGVSILGLSLFLFIPMALFLFIFHCFFVVLTGSSSHTLVRAKSSLQARPLRPSSTSDGMMHSNPSAPFWLDLRLFIGPFILFIFKISFTLTV
jgi:hypothetical protein